jgi:hypothetical protein
MAGMYPDDQTLQMFGETVSFPGLVNGKFSNGSFSNPLEKPSFIPAESINLILDNLTELIKAAGKTPNNSAINQLAVIWALKANLASPALTGTPTAPTAAAGTKTTQVATTAFVAAAINSLIAASPAALDTLTELAAALGNDPNFSTTILTALGLKAPLASPTFSGPPKLPTKTSAAGTDGTLLATEAQVALKANLASPTFTGTPKVPSKTSAAGTDGTLIATEAQVALKANLASPALTGTPTAPTAVAKTNNTQLATTAYADRSGHPVNSTYTQYPAAAANDYATAFPVAERPASLFCGTWTIQYDSEKVFFRTGGSLAAETDRNNGLQGDAARNITGYYDNNGNGNYGIGSKGSDWTSSGAFVFSGSNSNSQGYNSGAGYSRLSFDSSRVVPTAAENRPINRRFIIWKRTA